MAVRSCSLALLFLLCTFPAFAQNEPGYDSLLAQAKKGDPKTDFLKLRMTFTKTAGYNPYFFDRKMYQEMSAAFAAKDYDKAIMHADKILAAKYVDIDAHAVAMRSYAALGKTDQAKLHRVVIDGLVQSILKSGNGKSPASAYVVISTDEEYAILGALGLKSTKQALVNENGQKFDRLTVRDEKSKEPAAMYFNVNTQFSWLAERMKKEK
jgi:hypothetical protein